MKQPLLLLTLLVSLRLNAQLNIVPMPVEVKPGSGFAVIKQPIGFILYDFDKENEYDGVEPFKKYLEKEYHFTQFKDGDTHSYGLPFEIHYGTVDKSKPEGYYELEVTDNKVYIHGNAAGKYYAFETLKQLIHRNAKGELVIPHCTIKDYPRFAYRGMHLDVCRHFFPVKVIKQYIDYLAAYKFNTFHWHLTDDQGWRIEIKKYPKLTTTGAYRNGTIIGRYPGKGNDSITYGGYYTQQQIREVVKYAAERHITVVPEIEMPGHSSAAIAAYPQLSCFPAEDTKVAENTAWAGPRTGKQVQQAWGVFEDVYCPSEYTFNFLENVLDEVMRLFPSRYIHIGGDESPKEAWKRSPLCQQLMKAKGLKDEHELQSYFIQRIEKYVNSKGRRIIGWDEILEGGLAPGATVMSWQGESGGIAAAKLGHDVIMTPGTYCYFDHNQTRNEDSVTIGGYLPLEMVYNYEPIPGVLDTAQAKHILGAQANLWTEYIGNTSKIQYMLFPRMMALSEVLWTPKANRNWNDFESRLPVIFNRLDQQHINYSLAYYDLQAGVSPAGDFNGVVYSVQTKNRNGMIYANTAQNDPTPLYSNEMLIKNSSTVYLSLYDTVRHKTMPGITQTFSFNKATGKPVTLATAPSKSYPGNGAFTLVDGIQNTKGLARSTEFLGFAGTDLDIMIDLREPAAAVNKITLHVFDQNASWIYLPASVEVTYLPDQELTEAVIAAAPKTVVNIDPVKQRGQRTIVIEYPQHCRRLHIVAKNFGTIPTGYPGAGNKAWLFADEIEVQ